jgi:hypothetical protein
LRVKSQMCPTASALRDRLPVWENVRKSSYLK